MDDSRWERWAGLGGIAFAVLAAISAFIPGSPPKVTDSAAKIARFVTDKEAELRWGAYLGTIAVVPLFWWLGSVWRLMRRAEGGTPRLAVAALAGAVFAGAVAAVSTVVLAAMPIIGLRALGPDGIRVFYVLGTNLGLASLFGLAVFVGAFSAVLVRSVVGSAVVGWLGALLAVAALVGGAAVATTSDVFWYVGFAAFIAALVWVVIVGVLMLLRSPGALVEVDVVEVQVSTA